MFLVSPNAVLPGKVFNARDMVQKNKCIKKNNYVFITYSFEFSFHFETGIVISIKIKLRHLFLCSNIQYKIINCNDYYDCLLWYCCKTCKGPNMSLSVKRFFPKIKCLCTFYGNDFYFSNRQLMTNFILRKVNS